MHELFFFQHGSTEKNSSCPFNLPCESNSLIYKEAAWCGFVALWETLLVNRNRRSSNDILVRIFKTTKISRIQSQCILWLTICPLLPSCPPFFPSLQFRTLVLENIQRVLGIAIKLNLKKRMIEIHKCQESLHFWPAIVLLSPCCFLFHIMRNPSVTFSVLSQRQLFFAMPGNPPIPK